MNFEACDSDQRFRAGTVAVGINPVSGRTVVAGVVGIVLLIAAWNLRGQREAKPRFRRWQPQS